MQDNGGPVNPEEGSRQAQILAEYQAMADGYDSGSADCGWAAPGTLVGALERLGVLREGMDILDFAVGTGALSQAFRQSSAGETFHITATDLSPAMLEKSREKGVADDLLQQDITKPWQFTRESKDVIAATGVGEYLTTEELGTVIKEAAAVLRPGGVLAFTFLPAAEGSDKSAGPQMEHYLSEVQTMYAENGLSLTTSESFDAYRTDDGTMIRHVLAVGHKP